MAWPTNPRPAKSIVKLRDQVDVLAPKRDKSSDGMIGDAAHQTTKSDHNPSNGIVHAIDITHDPEHGVDSYAMAEQLRLVRDPRTKYVISNKRIFGDEDYAKRNGQKAWTWYQYSGKNPHSEHVHVSVNDRNADDTSSWAIAISPSTGESHRFRRPILKLNDEGPHVSELQALLGLTPDRIFGPDTDKALRDFQKAAGLDIDGYAGPYTWDALFARRLPSKIIFNVKATVFNDTTLAYEAVSADTLGVSLPARIGGVRPKVWVRNRANDWTAVAEVIDVGPWNTTDDYWNKGTRPQAESGTDLTGRKTNLAGIDLYPALATALGIPFNIKTGTVASGDGKVDWGFLPDGPVVVQPPAPPPEPPQPEPPTPVPTPVPTGDAIIEACLAEFRATLERHVLPALARDSRINELHETITTMKTQVDNALRKIEESEK